MQSFDFDKIVTQLLTISNFRDDKKEFIKEFESQNYFEAILNLIDRLPITQRSKIKEKIRLENPQKLKEYILTVFSQDEFLLELNKVRTIALKGLMTSLLPTLHSEQIKKIDNLLGRSIVY